MKPILPIKDSDNNWIKHTLTPHPQRAYTKPAPDMAPMKLYGERTVNVRRMCGQCAAYPYDIYGFYGLFLCFISGFCFLILSMEKVVPGSFLSIILT
jgi:hypothetical protein